METGSSAGARFALPWGLSVIGRRADLDVALVDPSVSRVHAEVHRADPEVTIRDLGSANGTYVNGQRLHGTHRLVDGDELRLGSVVLRYRQGAPAIREHLPPRPTGTSAPGPTHVGDVQGPVQTGSGQQYHAGRDQYVAGRDLRFDQRVHIQHDYDPWDEVFQGRGIGRVMMIVGGLASATGFALWATTLIVLAMSEPFAYDSPFHWRPYGIPVAIVGLASFAIGGVLAAVGSGLSKAARKRFEHEGRRGWTP